MNKYLLLIGFVILFFTACLDTNLPNVNGMWQLKHIESEDGNIQSVDTIYYSFQRQAVFSYTELYEGNPSTAQVLYGFVYFPEDKKIHIQMDKGYTEAHCISSLIWRGTNVTYDILKLNSKEMILFSEGKTYKFIKF